MGLFLVDLFIYVILSFTLFSILFVDQEFSVLEE